MSAATPTFDPATNTITLPSVAGVVYKIDGFPVEGERVITRDTNVSVRADRGYVLHKDVQREHKFTYVKPEEPVEGDASKAKDSDTSKVVAGADATAVEANVPSGSGTPRVGTSVSRTTQP